MPVTIHTEELQTETPPPAGQIWKNYILAGGQRVAMREYTSTNPTGTVYFLLGDHLGSTSVVVNVSTGAVVSQIRYSAYGEERYTENTTPTNYRYTGQLSKMSTVGLYFYGSRWLDPQLAHFAQADTIVPGTGNPLAWDRYLYTLGNPMMYVDPTGHTSACGFTYSDPECPTGGNNSSQNGSGNGSGNQSANSQSTSSTSSQIETEISNNTDISFDITRDLYIPPEVANSIDYYGDYLYDPTFIDYISGGGVRPGTVAAIPAIVYLLSRFYWYNPPQLKATVSNVFWKFTASYTKTDNIHLSEVTVHSYRPNVILKGIEYKSGDKKVGYKDGYYMESGFGANNVTRGAPSDFSSKTPLVITLFLSYFRGPTFWTVKDQFILPPR